MTTSTSSRHDDKGFTLIEILIAIVVVGILSAVVVIGISSLTSKGNKTACAASRDAAIAATTVYFANESKYPITMDLLTVPMTGGVPAALTLPSNVTVATGANVTSGSGATWVLTMTPGSPSATANAPTFACT
jgi:prepilin-type N-terminal cleavage/methylation domain-containing protein